MTISTNNPQIFDRLSSQQLPVLPPGAPLLLETLTDDTVDFVQISSILERYPTIAARLIALANSAWSAPATEITSLEMACARLGFDVVRTTSIALAVAAPFDPNRCPGFNAEYYWTTALLAADGAAWLTPYCTSIAIETGTARAAGLLHNLGLLWLADQLPDEVQQAVEINRKSETLDLREALQKVIGVDYCEAGKHLGEAWQLPTQLIDAMAEHAKTADQLSHSKIANLVGLCTTMVSALHHHAAWSPPFVQLHSLSINPTDTQKVLERLSVQFEKTQELARTLFN